MCTIPIKCCCRMCAIAHRKPSIAHFLWMKCLHLIGSCSGLNAFRFFCHFYWSIDLIPKWAHQIILMIPNAAISKLHGWHCFLTIVWIVHKFPYVENGSYRLFFPQTNVFVLFLFYFRLSISESMAKRLANTFGVCVCACVGSHMCAVNECISELKVSVWVDVI